MSRPPLSVHTPSSALVTSDAGTPPNGGPGSQQLEVLPSNAQGAPAWTRLPLRDEGELTYAQVFPLNVSSHGVLARLALSADPWLQAVQDGASRLPHAPVFIGESLSKIGLGEIGVRSPPDFTQIKTVAVERSDINRLLVERTVSADGEELRLTLEPDAVAKLLAGSGTMVVGHGPGGLKLLSLQVTEAAVSSASAGAAMDELFIRPDDLSAFLIDPVIDGIRGDKIRLDLTIADIKSLIELGNIDRSFAGRELVVIVAEPPADLMRGSHTRVRSVWRSASAPAESFDDVAVRVRKLRRDIHDNLASPARPLTRSRDLAISYVLPWRMTWALKGVVYGRPVPAGSEAGALERVGKRLAASPMADPMVNLVHRSGLAAALAEDFAYTLESPELDLVAEGKTLRLASGVDSALHARRMLDRLASSAELASRGLGGDGAATTGSGTIQISLSCDYDVKLAARPEAARLCAYVRNPLAGTEIDQAFLQQYAPALRDAWLDPSLAADFETALEFRGNHGAADLEILAPHLQAVTFAAERLFGALAQDAAESAALYAAFAVSGEAGKAQEFLAFDSKDVEDARAWLAARLIYLRRPALAEVLHDMVGRPPRETVKARRRSEALGDPSGDRLTGLVARLDAALGGYAGPDEMHQPCLDDIRAAYAPLLSPALRFEKEFDEAIRELEGLGVGYAEDFGLLRALNVYLGVRRAGDGAETAMQAVRRVANHVEANLTHYAYHIFAAQPATQQQRFLDHALASVEDRSLRRAFLPAPVGRAGEYLLFGIDPARLESAGQLIDFLGAAAGGAAARQVSVPLSGVKVTLKT